MTLDRFQSMRSSLLTLVSDNNERSPILYNDANPGVSSSVMLHFDFTLNALLTSSTAY